MRLLFAISLLSLAIVAGCTSSSHTSEYRPDWLSPSAKIVFTSQHEDGFLPDAAFKLKAKTSEANFESAVKKLDLTAYKLVPQSTYSNEPPQWLDDSSRAWDVSYYVDDSFIRKEGRWWQLAKYTNGFLYYQSVSY